MLSWQNDYAQVCKTWDVGLIPADNSKVLMVGVAQSVERRTVTAKVAGSNPVAHPKFCPISIKLMHRSCKSGNSGEYRDRAPFNTVMTHIFCHDRHIVSLALGAIGSASHSDCEGSRFDP